MPFCLAMCDQIITKNSSKAEVCGGAAVVYYCIICIYILYSNVSLEDGQLGQATFHDMCTVNCYT